ncbi:MAG: hypothetical protein KDB73_07050 [Planctomycetes bacterium]|nr:hypothetical protein [Planctomycetota bacterium]
MPTFEIDLCLPLPPTRALVCGRVTSEAEPAPGMVVTRASGESLHVVEVRSIRMRRGPALLGLVVRASEPDALEELRRGMTLELHAAASDSGPDVAVPPPTEHGHLVRHYIAQAFLKGQPAIVSAPPLFRLLWRCGLKLPPPAMMSWWGLFATVGGYMAVAVWLLVTIFGLTAASWLASLVVAAAFGLTFGLLGAVTYRRKGRRLGLPPWHSYAGIDRVFPDTTPEVPAPGSPSTAT